MRLYIYIFFRLFDSAISKCRLPATQHVPGMQWFANADDWCHEIDRCNCAASWRLCLANNQYQLSGR